VEGPDDAQEVLSDLIGEATALQQTGTQKDLLTPVELASRFVDHRLRVEAGEAHTSVSTGFRDIDLILGGGMLASGMYILAARPGMGKTTLALNIADRVAKNAGPVLFVSLEMDDEQLMAKRIARESGVPGNRLLMSRLSDPENEKIAQATEQIARLPVYVNSKPSATVGEIVSLARRVDKLKLIVVDYLGKISPGKRGNTASRYEYTTEISGELKTMARTFKIPVLVLCQLNRNSENRKDKRPKLADLRDTGAVEQDADGVIFLYRQEYYGEVRNKDPYVPEEIEVILAKNRHGGTGDCKLAMYPAVSKLVATDNNPRSEYKKAVEAGMA
jgi:replicative DNA helicase